jgi:hypothetical protein
MRLGPTEEIRLLARWGPSPELSDADGGAP